MAKQALQRVRKILFTLPEVAERIAPGGALCFKVEKKTLCYYHDDKYDGQASLWCRALIGLQQELVDAYPARFFKPQPSSSGTFASWLGVFLDGPSTDWMEVATILTDAYREVASKRLVERLDDA